ncbi:MAG: NAD-dependent succinate-semialdehyde dehydrogenase [Alphaproteobacteria bacterium]|nr:NAD-dependent succinate-semialdehyde dehydrogenase [Alphaproteobacteria bacterium]
MIIKSINPASEKLLTSFEGRSKDDIDQALVLSVEAFEQQKALTFAGRAEKMLAAAQILEDENEALALLLTEEMGKTLVAARAEVKKCAWVCRFYAENAEGFLADHAIQTQFSNSYVRFLPLGPILAVMPWNFPFWQVFRFAAPALMAGNTALLKHASSVPQAAMAIEDIFWRAGFPEGAFQTLLIGSDQVAPIIADPRIRALTLTGSEKAGAAVAAQAGAHIKKCVLELGGSDPFIVMPSANLKDAVEQAVKGRIQNNGQSCIAAKRFIIHKDIYSDFRDQFVAAFEALQTGDPMLPETDVGPLATPQIREDLEAQVNASINAGATRLCGAQKIDGPGYFFKPGILENIPQSSPAFSEELFGPVACLFQVGDMEEAIHLSNATRFGLGSALFTQDPREIEQAVNGIEAGATFINAITASDPRLPFGGTKASGYGRELACAGVREFMNFKTVCVQ